VSSRRAAIADSGIRIIARDGVRALTHRAVDREAGIPQGSTSYHAKTRIALIGLIVDSLAARATADAEELARTLDAEFGSDRRIDPAELARLIAGLVDVLASRREDMRARYALILELDDEPLLRSRLTSGSTVHAVTARLTVTLLARAGIPASDEQVEDLLALTDALVFHRTALDGGASPEAILTRYLSGAAADLRETGETRVRPSSPR
jgi:DNA-binding transcriptional regulator YbjK